MRQAYLFFGERKITKHEVAKDHRSKRLLFFLRSTTVRPWFARFVMRFLNGAISRTKRALPYPARMLSSRSIAWMREKVITHYMKTPFFPISANLAVFCRSVTRLKTRAGYTGAGFGLTS